MVLLALVGLRDYTNTWWVGGNGGGPGRCWWWRCLDRADRLSSGQGMMLDGGRSGEEVDSYRQTDRQTRGAGHSEMKSRYIHTVSKVQCGLSRWLL